MCDKCLSKNIPFNDHTINPDDDEPRATGIVRTDESLDGSYCESDFQVFGKKGLHTIHIHARSLRNKLTDMIIQESTHVTDRTATL